MKLLVVLRSEQGDEHYQIGEHLYSRVSVACSSRVQEDPVRTNQLPTLDAHKPLERQADFPAGLQQVTIALDREPVDFQEVEHFELKCYKICMDILMPAWFLIHIQEHYLLAVDDHE